VGIRGGNLANEADGNIGKIPLALQQLALAKFRAEESGDTETAKLLGEKMKELLAKI